MDAKVPVLLDWQGAFIHADADYMCMFAGRRSGKTESFYHRMGRLCTQYDGMRIMYATPLYSQGAEVFERMCASEFWRPYITKFIRRPNPRIYFETAGEDSFIEFRSLQRPGNLVSVEWDEVYIDESQANEVTQMTIEAVIVPMLRGRIARHRKNNGRGTLIFGGQFRGKDWRYENYWLPGAEKVDGQPNKIKRPGFRSWQIPSSRGYAFGVQPGGLKELEDLKVRTPKVVFEQEYECLPASNMNALFDPVYLEKIKCGQMETEPKPGSRYIAGIDLGGKHDFTTICVLKVQKFGSEWRGAVVHAEDLPLNQPHELYARKTAQIAARYSASCVVDTTGGGKGGHYRDTPDEAVRCYRQEVQASGLAFHSVNWNTNNKNTTIRNLEVAFQSGQLTIPAAASKLHAELQAFEYVYNSNTRQTYYQAPKHGHDDHVSALAAAWNGVLEGRVPTGTGYKGLL